MSSGDRITRRDFVNGALVGAGALFAPGCTHLGRAPGDAQTWDGFGGVGDYARSHGNSYAVREAGHLIRDGAYQDVSAAVDTREEFDLVVVGGGLSGLSAALRFLQERPGGTCLVLDNHQIFGGESKRNEFNVRGHLVTGPQGANSFPLPQTPGKYGFEHYAAIGMPREFQYVEPTGAATGLEYSSDSYMFQTWKDASPSFGWFFGGKRGAENWVRDIWSDDLARAPYPEAVKADLLKWRSSVAPNGGPDQSEEGFRRWLDTLSYQDVIEKVMGLSPIVSRYIDPVLASSVSGAGCDLVSALAAYYLVLPGLWDPKQRQRITAHRAHSFPGGNDGFTRHYVKTLIPSAIEGGRELEGIMNSPVDFAALDRTGQPVRIRLGATAVDVMHEGSPQGSATVALTYERGGALHKLTARAVVMAGGSWTTRHVVRDLPEAHRRAYQQFYRTPMLVANVAVKHWRFMADYGMTACRWFEGFGYCCNIRPPMAIGRHRPPFDPEQPAVLTFYVPFCYPNQGSIHEQAARGRAEMFATTYSQYETRIRDQMALLFGTAGFRQQDIAGIVLNRWGHAYVCPQPGFYFGTNGQAAPSEIIRKVHGRVTFAHSELNGHQHWVAAADEGWRAAGQSLTLL